MINDNELGFEPEETNETEQHAKQATGTLEDIPDTQHIIEPPPAGEVRTIMTIGGESSGPMVIHTVGVAQDAPGSDTSNLVKVRIQYPAKWNKPRFFKDGAERMVSKETAERFVKNKMAVIIPDEKVTQ